MNITFLLPYAGLQGGIRVVAVYADLLSKRGHRVNVISLPLKEATLKKKMISFLKNKRWPIQKNGPSHFDNLMVDHKILKKYRPIKNDDVPDADAIIATWWETAEWMKNLYPSKGKKFYFIQGHEVHENLPIERVKSTYFFPFHKIVVSRWLQDIMTNVYGDNDVTLIPNCVDHDVFYAPQRNKQVDPTIGFMYSTHPFKGCNMIIESLNAARKIIPNLRVFSFGSCQLTKNLPLPPSSYFYFQPSQKKIREIYSKCDFWLFGSKSEGFGLPLLESMACRTPVIGTPVGAAPELLINMNGILLDDFSSESMTKAILTACNLNTEEWVMMSEKAFKTSRQHSWDKAVISLEKTLINT
jgi:glycosyltransferase involved in cell wall biosynthesis